MASAAKWVYYWYSALEQRAGIYLRTQDPLRLKSLLYSARARHGDPALAHLQIRTSPRDPQHEILIFNPDCIKDNPR